MKTGPFKMKGKSPMMKALVGNQGNLNAGLQAAIKASPATMKKASPAKLDGVKDYIKKVGDTKIKDVGKKAVKVGKKVNKKIYDATVVGKIDNYIKEKKKGKRGASTAGTKAGIVAALSKSRKNAAREAATRSGGEAAKSYKKQLEPVSLTLDQKTSLGNKGKGLNKGTGAKEQEPMKPSKRSIGKMKKKK